MPRIRIDLSYDGGEFCGWQLQKTDPSVQGAIEEALLSLTGEEIRVIGSGRTDSGVHARCQTAHFDTEASIPPQKYTPALNGALPLGVRILRSGEVSPRFHARFSARLRSYRYQIIPGRKATPFDSRYALALKGRPNLQRLNALARMLVGTHDFSTFTAAGDPSESRVRRIESALFFPLGEMILFQISGNAFLWRMVRSIVGTLLEMEAQGRGPEELARILASGERSAAGVTAPAMGLFLYKVEYDEEFRI